MSMKLAAAIVMLIAGSAVGAQAEPWSRHAPLCRTVYPSNQPDVYFWVGLASGSPYDVTVICPIPDTSDRPDSQITEVRVYVSHYSIISSFSVRACRTARTGLESVCGPLAWSSSQTNVITLNPGLHLAADRFRLPRGDHRDWRCS